MNLVINSKKNIDQLKRKVSAVDSFQFRLTLNAFYRTLEGLYPHIA